MSPLSIFRAALVGIGLVLGYLGMPLLSGVMPEPVGPIQWPVFILGGAVISIFAFLTHARVPPRAVFAIEEERRRDPDGPCSQGNLRLFALNVLLACIALLAWVVGAYASGTEQTNRTFLSILLLVSVVFIAGVLVCWLLLKIPLRRS